MDTPRGEMSRKECTPAGADRSMAIWTETRKIGGGLLFFLFGRVFRRIVGFFHFRFDLCDFLNLSLEPLGIKENSIGSIQCFSSNLEIDLGPLLGTRRENGDDCRIGKRFRSSIFCIETGVLPEIDRQGVTERPTGAVDEPPENSNCSNTYDLSNSARFFSILERNFHDFSIAHRAGTASPTFRAPRVPDLPPFRTRRTHPHLRLPGLGRAST